ncbi:hypothetical protein EWM64_g2912 [Hericium alpestre]|uniref:BTB domain-containing protein n=1 Tax=Hericium alpestre TaxID=135208 RepID=A0A4Z0A441_9AGAM|nr:hypothetical protein EWM64_g2912 [Hericium alpestre]
MSFANFVMSGIEATHSTPASSKTPVQMADSDCSPVISSPTDIMSVSSTESFGSTDGGQAQSPNSNVSVSHTAIDPPPQYKKHDRFYFDDGNVTFIVSLAPESEVRLVCRADPECPTLQVQDVAFRVHRYFFQRDSKYFADLFKQQSGEEAVREDEPIHLNDVASDEFEALLKLMYPL